jgi:hypothetical protein
MLGDDDRGVVDHGRHSGGSRADGERGKQEERGSRMHGIDRIFY